MQIYVKNLKGIPCTVEVPLCETVRDLKSRLHACEGVPPPPDLQRLVFEGRQLWDDDRTLASYGIQEYSTLQFAFRQPCQKMSIYVNTLTEMTLTLEVPPCERVGNIKARVEDKVNIPLDQQRMTFGVTQLDDGRTLASYNIQEGSHLHLVRSVTG